MRQTITQAPADCVVVQGTETSSRGIGCHPRGLYETDDNDGSLGSCEDSWCGGVRTEER